MKTLVVVAALLSVAMAMSVRKMAPLYAADSPTQINGSYIVVFYKDIGENIVRTHHATIARKMMGEEKVVFKYGTALNGYSAILSDKLRDEIRQMPEVKYVERNQEVRMLQGQDCVEGRADSWGLARTTVENNPGNSPLYIYDENCDGEGSNVYVIDTGIDLDVDEFEGRAEFGVDYVDGGGGDPNGHGTHVTGTVLSQTYGLARKATGIAVRVLNAGGSGTYEAVISGINYVAEQTRPNRIINMSLGGGRSEAVNDAVEAAFRAGVHVVVAAGNENTDACTRSPASAEFATTVGATDINDARAYFSNYGTCTEIFGPGVNIRAPTGRGNYADYSGTSMASPHVAGVIAKYLTNEDCRPGATGDSPQEIEDYIKERSVKGVITGLPTSDTPNELIHMPCEG